MPSLRNALADSAYRTFVHHVRKLRRASGMTQGELATKLGQPQSYVSKTERYERRMDVAEFRFWVLSLGADPAQEFAVVSRSLADDELALGDEDLLATDDGGD